MEVLEDRRLLTGTSATLQPIANVTVPSLQGTTIPLLAASGATDPQTYTVTSSNPECRRIDRPGTILDSSASRTPTPPMPRITSPAHSLTSCSQNLTPNTVSEISNLTNNGYFVNSGKYFNRVYAGFVVQGGSPTPDGSEPNPPVTFGNELVQQLAFTGTYQLAMANEGQPNTDTTQFFTTLAPNNSLLSYSYTLFGQLLTGESTINQMLNIPLVYNSTSR